MDNHLEREKLRIERARIAGELRIRRAELRLKQEELRRGKASSPVVVTAVAALLGLFGTALSHTIQGWSSYRLERTRAESQVQLERSKFESELIRKAVEVPDLEVRKENLLFYIEARFIRDEGGHLAKLVRSDATPVFASSPANAVTPNFSRSDSTRKIDVIVIGDTGDPSFENTKRWYQEAVGKQSTHYLIGTDGRMETLVPEQHVAWHAGVSSWKSWSGLNRNSIGVRLVHVPTPQVEFARTRDNLPADHPAFGPGYPQAQLDALVTLVADIVKRHNVSLENIITHQQASPNRKVTDLSSSIGLIRERVRRKIAT